MVKKRDDRDRNKSLWAGENWFCFYFLPISYDIASFLDAIGGIVGKDSAVQESETS
jgi:hypothetical protein